MEQYHTVLIIEALQQREYAAEDFTDDGRVEKPNRGHCGDLETSTSRKPLASLG